MANLIKRLFSRKNKVLGTLGYRYIEPVQWPNEQSSAPFDAFYPEDVNVLSVPYLVETSKV